MYIPPNTVPLNKAKDPQIRLGIQGFPGTGKTWAALTFPNPIVLNLDRGLGAHFGREDVIEVPIWSRDFCKTINPNFGNSPSCMLRDIIDAWFEKEAKKLEEDQTLVIDGITGMQNAYHTWYSLNPAVTKVGKIDDYAEWRLKLVFLGDICDKLKMLRCNVIVIAHETEKKDKGGDYTGKIRPLLRGQFGDELSSHFTDWVRAVCATKPRDFDTLNDQFLKNWNMDKVQFEGMCKTFPRNSYYYWQLESDDIFDGKVSSLVNFPRYIPARYEYFRNYMKQISST